MHLSLPVPLLLPLQLGALLAICSLCSYVTRWLGQPKVIAEVVAGIALGPSLVGYWWPELMNGLFPAASLPALKLLSQLGLVLFMFSVGLEMDPKLLIGRARASVAISHTSIRTARGKPRFWKA